MDTNEKAVVDAQNNEAEGGAESQEETISISKSEWEKHQQTLGSLKRELKDLRKPKDEPKETAQQTKSDESQLLAKIERMSLRQAGITDPEDVELAQKTAKKWNMDIDEVLSDPDFKIKLERQQTERANTQATSKVKGGTGGSQAKNSPDYWKAKGVPPTPADIPDRKTRATIIRAMMSNAKNAGGKYWNE